jgi:hypothetical protein
MIDTPDFPDAAKRAMCATGFMRTARAVLLVVYATLTILGSSGGSALAVTAAATPAPTPTPGPRASNDRPLYFSAGKAKAAVFQGANADTMLLALEFALAEIVAGEKGKRIVFEPETPAGECADVNHDVGLLELTSGRFRTTDDNYVVVERYNTEILLAFRFLKCDGTVVSEYPRNLAKYHDKVNNVDVDEEHEAVAPWSKPHTVVLPFLVVGGALIADARNTNKTAAAELAFAANFNKLIIPAYHPVDAQYELMLEAAKSSMGDLFNPELGACQLPDNPKDGLQGCRGTPDKPV